MEYLYAPDNLSLGQMAARWVARFDGGDNSG